MPLIRACAYGERRTATCAIPGSFRSSRYLAAPVIRRGSSTRLMRAPITLVVVASSTWVVMTSPHRRRADGLDDVLVAGAAAEVALEPAPDLRVGEPVAVRAEQLDAGHDHARRAEPALKRVALPERLLEWMQFAVVRQALDRGYVAAVGLDREHGARLHRVSIEMDRAGAAHRRVAADLRAREVELVADEVDEQRPRLDLRLVANAVDRERDRYHRVPPFRRVPPRTCAGSRCRAPAIATLMPHTGSVAYSVSTSCERVCRHATSSARIATAISSCADGPRSSPAGERTRARDSSSNPASTTEARFELATSPMYSASPARALSSAASSSCPIEAITTASAPETSVVTRQPSTPASSRSVRAAGASPTTASKGAGSCGSISTSTAPSEAQRLSIRSRRTSPSARASSARRATSGSVQAPPTQPRSSPSAVTKARSPTRADEGRSTPTTVASANGVPSAARRPASTRTFTPPDRPRSAPPTPCRGSSACRGSARLRARARR